MIGPASFKRDLRSSRSELARALMTSPTTGSKPQKLNSICPVACFKTVAVWFSVDFAYNSIPQILYIRTFKL
jgi:hypothetical protein